jgi:hypothetical protein
MPHCIEDKFDSTTIAGIVVNPPQVVDKYPKMLRMSTTSCLCEPGMGIEMNLDRIVAKGYRPWLPNGQATDLEVLHAHDIPLGGTFAVGSKRVLFLCVTGATERSSVWAYKVISKEELDDLQRRDFTGPEELEDFAQDLFLNDTAVIAYALDSAVRTWAIAPITEGVPEAVVPFLEDTLHASESERHRAAQARADATRTALESAAERELEHA